MTNDENITSTVDDYVSAELDKKPVQGVQVAVESPYSSDRLESEIPSPVSAVLETGKHPAYIHNCLLGMLELAAGGESCGARWGTAKWMLEVCRFVIQDLEEYGLCVIDNFLGEEKGSAILDAVLAMRELGVFCEGKTAAVASVSATRTVRGDDIAWVDGTEPYSRTISTLISTVDAIIMNCCKLGAGTSLAGYDLNGRTKVPLEP